MFIYRFNFNKKECAVESSRKKIDENREIEESVNEAWPMFVRFLKEKNARITQARKIVFTQVFSRHDHFCADDLSASLARGPNHVSRGTVYRTLALMEEIGFVRVIRDTDVHAHYEHVFNHPLHEHMICDSCGTFIEFIDDELEARIKQVCKAHKFKERTHRVVIFGRCEKCQKN